MTMHFMPKTTTKNDSIVFDGLRLIAGQPGLDFLNTVKYRGRMEDGDRFVEFADMIKWALLAGLITKRESTLLISKSNPIENTNIHREIRGFREQTRIIFDAQQRGSAQFERALKFIEHAVSLLRPRININRETGVLEKYYPINQAIDLKFRIIASVDHLLQKKDQLTIKTCSGENCDWLFADNTKAKRRKWCDTRTCGNLVRVRKYRDH